MKKLALLVALLSTLAVAQTVTLTTTTSGTGSGTISGCAGTYAHNDYFQCNLSASPGSYLAGVSGCDDTTSSFPAHYSGGSWHGNIQSSSCTVNAYFKLVTEKPTPILTGSTPASYTLPGGWTTLTTNTFEGGTYTGTLDGMTVGSSPAPGHGSQSAVGTVTGDNSTTRWQYTAPLGTKCIYSSWYEYLPSSAGLYGEMFIADFGVNGQGTAHLDMFGASGVPTPLSTWENSPVGNLVEESEFSSPSWSKTNYTDNDISVGYTSAWHQWEALWCPNTPNNNDGYYEAWHDGALVLDFEKMNFNTSDDASAGPRIDLGGVYTVIMANNPDLSCLTLAQTCEPRGGSCLGSGDGGGYRCSNVASTACPCTAGGTPSGNQIQPTQFNRYFDDIIVALCTSGPCSLNQTTVTVSPQSVNLPVLGTQQFTANLASNWTASCGSITGANSTSGFYTAPATAPNTCAITATSGANSSTANATISALAVIPTTAALNVGASQQFTSNFPSTWSATGGTISGSGLYTAPSTNGTYTITATAVNGGATATATVTVTGEQTFIPLSISPASWTQQTTISTPITKTFTATNIGTGSVTPTVTLTGSAKFSISANTCTGAVSGGGNCTVTIQFLSATVGAFAATLNISDTAGGNQNLPLNVSIPSGTVVTISPLTATVPINGTQQFSASTSNGSGVTWSTTCSGGSVTAGLFTAGGSASVCTVTATTTDGSGANASASVTVVTVAVNPSAVTLQILSTQQFTANVVATWGASCGTITSAGRYTAPGAPATCTITATATNGGATGSATATVVNPPPGTHGGSQKGGKGRWKIFH